MTVHYNDKLEQVRDAAKNAERNKKAKTIKVVDNEDYKIFVTLNRAAACAVGLGTQWCTANSNHDSHFHRYAGEAFLFQVFPKTPEKVDKISGFNQKHITGDEKYQFGADSGLSFKDIADDQVDKNMIKGRFPYIYSDIVHGIKSNKDKIEQAFKELAADPTLQDKDFKIKTYELDKELEKLDKFVKAGYFTDKARPKKVEEPAAETPPPEQPQLSEEDDEMENMPQGGDLGSMGAGGPSGGGKYPQGTAPTMPESVNKGRIMEHVDKDVAAMLQSLKKYDKLVESVAPVLGMRTLTGATQISEKDMPKTNDTLANRPKNMIKDYGKEIKDIKKADPEEYKKAYPIDGPGKGKKLPEAADKKKDDSESDSEGGEIDEAKVNEGADADVLAWMGRFAKLGNMKGYGK
jgi:hypothetical protein